MLKRSSGGRQLFTLQTLYFLIGEIIPNTSHNSTEVFIIINHECKSTSAILKHKQSEPCGLTHLCNRTIFLKQNRKLKKKRKVQTTIKAGGVKLKQTLLYIFKLMASSCTQDTGPETLNSKRELKLK